MEIEFDPVKDAANLRKHGISLRRAGEIDLGEAKVFEDLRFDYGERRFRAYGGIDGRLHCLVFTAARQGIRAISLRKANRKEVASYGPEIPRTDG